MTIDRLDLLRSYVGQLAYDMKKAGKFAGSGANYFESAARAVLNGATAIGAQMLADLRQISGERAVAAVPIVETAVAGLAADGARAALGWAGGAIKDLFNGAAKQKQAQRKAGKALMDAAAKMKGHQ